MKRLIPITLALIVLGACSTPEPWTTKTKGVRYYVQSRTQPPPKTELRLLVNGVVRQKGYFDSHSVSNSVHVDPKDVLAFEVDDVLNGYEFNITLNFNNCCNNGHPQEKLEVHRKIKKTEDSSIFFTF